MQSKEEEKEQQPYDEQTYVKLTLREQILLRPDTYVDTLAPTTQTTWVCTSLTPEPVLRKTSIVVSPGLYKIFDEVLVNACDNHQRSARMKYISVHVGNGKITVENDGTPIPIKVHDKEGVYIPELIFGHMLTSSNYNDDVRRTTGGRNGYGAKLANIFSLRFEIDLCDGMRTYHQQFTDHMGHTDPPTIRDLPPSKQQKRTWTRVSFWPDFRRFGQATNDFDEDFLALVRRRVLDVAGIVQGLRVTFNDVRLPIRSFLEYARLYFGSHTNDNGASEQDEQGSSHSASQDPFVYYETPDKHWQVCAGLSVPLNAYETNGGGGSSSSKPAAAEFQQVSFVNGIWTVSGGTHVALLRRVLVDGLVAKLHRTTTPAIRRHLEQHLFLVVHCLVENPTFDTQTKMRLRTPLPSLPASFRVDLMMRKLVRHPLYRTLEQSFSLQELRVLKQSDGTKRKDLSHTIPKLDDAIQAGTAHSQSCTLILTEGDSAKALAVAGLSVVGRKHYGVFPLRGKLLNCRDVPPERVNKNEEISNLKQILGLRHGCTYATAAEMATLRYGRVMLMTDQDQDGSHIKGLIINFFHTYWPNLLRRRNPSFLVEFITPIVKVFPKSGSGGNSSNSTATAATRARSFYTIPQFRAWYESTSHASVRNVRIKYYKGLGTNTATEAKEYFTNLSAHLLAFVRRDDRDDASIVLAFEKKAADRRKQWLLDTYRPDLYLDHQACNGELCYAEFVDRELVLFSMADTVRSIPSMLDGLKPGQRKILHACMARSGTTYSSKEWKVAQLCGHVAERNAYHHGEEALAATIVGMAQSFVGSNNVPLLQPCGMFGTRLRGGKDAASSRYIFTNLAPYTRHLFHPLDDTLLDYLEDDGQRVEPRWFLPVLPSVLLNPCRGIGTGWSTDVLPYHPRDIVANLHRWRRGEPMQPMVPWFAHFKGTIRRVQGDSLKFISEGCIRRDSPSSVVIDELPIGMWTDSYKKILCRAKESSVGTSKAKATAAAAAGGTSSTKKTLRFAIDRFEEGNTEETVWFRVWVAREILDAAESEQGEGLAKAFLLQTTLSGQNMHLFDADGRIKRYASPQHILEEFGQLRRTYYAKRKAQLLHVLASEHARLENQTRFISAVIDGRLVLGNVAKSDLIARLQALGFASDAASDDTNAAAASSSSCFDYLLNMKLWNMTKERVAFHAPSDYVSLG